MAKPKSNKPSGKNRRKTHPGSSVEDARAVGGKGDFGAAESDVVERTYVSTNTKRSDPGAAPPRAGAGGDRTSGVGGTRSGPGSSSGGDLDTDIVGVGTGGRGVAASGKVDEPPGPDDATGTSRDFASGAPSQGGNPSAPPELVRGSTVQLPDDRTVGAKAPTRRRIRCRTTMPSPAKSAATRRPAATTSAIEGPLILWLNPPFAHRLCFSPTNGPCTSGWRPART